MTEENRNIHHEILFQEKLQIAKEYFIDHYAKDPTIEEVLRQWDELFSFYWD